MKISHNQVQESPQKSIYFRTRGEFHWSKESRLLLHRNPTAEIARKIRRKFKIRAKT